MVCDLSIATLSMLVIPYAGLFHFSNGGTLMELIKSAIPMLIVVTMAYSTPSLTPLKNVRANLILCFILMTLTPLAHKFTGTVGFLSVWGFAHGLYYASSHIYMIRNAESTDRNTYSLASSSASIMIRVITPIICVVVFNTLKGMNIPEIYGFGAMISAVAVIGLLNTRKLVTTKASSMKWEHVKRALMERGKYNFKIWSLFSFNDMVEGFILASFLSYIVLHNAANVSVLQAVASIVSVTILVFLMGKKRGTKRLLFGGIILGAMYVINSYIPFADNTIAPMILTATVICAQIVRPIFGNFAVILSFDVTHNFPQDEAENRMIIRDWFVFTGRMSLTLCILAVDYFFNDKTAIAASYLIAGCFTFIATYTMRKFYKRLHHS